MDLQQLKKIKAETGASFSECKKAIRNTSSFEDAVSLAIQYRQEREDKENTEEEINKK